MGCCSSSLLLADINPVNQVDRHLQKKAGQKLEEHLAQHNNRFAEDPDDYRKKAAKDTRVNGTGEEGKWGKTRQTLARAENITEFAKHLNLTQKNMQAALSKFLALDTDGNGYIDKKEFAEIFKLNAQCATTTHMFDSIDVDRDGKINYKEFMVVAAHFNQENDGTSKARFCFKMVDADNDGFASYEELKGFLLDVMYPDSSAKHRMVGRIDKLLKDKLCVTTDVRLKEEDFVELVRSHKDVFTPMLVLYSKLHKVFDHALDNSTQRHTNQEVQRYFDESFNRSSKRVDGSDASHHLSGDYSPRHAHNAVPGKKQKLDFQHNFEECPLKENKKKQQRQAGSLDIPWKKDVHLNQFAGIVVTDSDNQGGGGRNGGPPKLQRKISQDDLSHNYETRPKPTWNAGSSAGASAKGRDPDHIGREVPKLQRKQSQDDNFNAYNRAGDFKPRNQPLLIHGGGIINDEPEEFETVEEQTSLEQFKRNVQTKQLENVAPHPTHKKLFGFK